jgi:hypothetical protein
MVRPSLELSKGQAAKFVWCVKVKLKSEHETRERSATGNGKRDVGEEINAENKIASTLSECHEHIGGVKGHGLRLPRLDSILS